ncbi:hypothetical protein PENPOL_c002G09509 [Penicillium polonicum]|uniref:Uncharacterized protein n=1 Tax=Penicillium polonicum TaxID=60169 RepID=A0A1V6NWJ3_PENPO|nr:hypothetical protein PENPOL_c002G09509 [Penicillium polonicum]
MTHSHPQFEQGADKETVDGLRPIPTPDSDQGDRAMRRSHLREMALRDATREMGYLQVLAEISEFSDAVLLQTLDGIMGTLFDKMITLRTEERADAAFEQELWRQVTEYPRQYLVE